MKKSITLREQIEAARKEVDAWPEMIKKATEMQCAAFYPDEDEAKATESKKEECRQPLHC